jgi:hypothetical protein
MISLLVSCREAHILFKAMYLLWYFRFGSSFSFDFKMLVNQVGLCPLS